MKICAQVSNQCSAGEQRNNLGVSPGHQVRCQTLDAPFYVFHRFFWCQSLGVSGVPCLLEEAVCRVLRSGVTGGGLSGVCPKWKGLCNMSVMFLWCLEAVGSL